MSLDFLVPSPAARDGAESPVARSPMEHSARAAGARLEIREGWNLAVGYGLDAESEAATAAQSAGWSDASHLTKLELQGAPETLESVAGECEAELRLGEAVRAGEAWWCRLTPTRALVICEPSTAGAVRERLTQAAAAADGASVVDVTTVFAALTVVGPLAREVFARFCAIDLRPSQAPIRALRPGSIGRQPGIVICEAEERYLFLFGWAIGEYMWSIVTDAGLHLGGAPIGVDALALLPGAEAAAQEESVGA